MSTMLPQIYVRLDRTLYTRYVTLCTTFVAILSVDSMPTSMPTIPESTYATHAPHVTESRLESSICSRLTASSPISDSPCRPESNKCDLPEFCTTGGYCPPDVHLADRTPCDFNDGICFRGQCYLTNLPCGAFSTHTAFSSDSINNSVNIPPVTDVCTRHEVCVDGRCLSINSITGDICPSSEDGQKCSGNGRCTNENTCICRCGWLGSACDVRSDTNAIVLHSTEQSLWCLPEERSSDTVTNMASTTEEDTRNPSVVMADNKDQDEVSSTTFLANAIIGGSIALMFGVAVIFGATSIGFRKVRKKDRLRTMHQFRIMSIFQPTKAQQRKLNRQGGPHYSKGYRDRRKDNSKNKDQRIILEPERNHRDHTKYKPPRPPQNHNIPIEGSSKILSETCV